MGQKSLSWDEFGRLVAQEGVSFTVIHGKVYNTSSDFLQWHPGGKVAATQIGGDGSAAFEAFHDANTEELLANFYVCDIRDNQAKENHLARDFSEIHRTIRQNGWWHSSKLYYCWKAISTSSFACVSLWILGTHAEHSIILLIIASCLMAIFFQQAGWLGHDFLHNQVFSERKYNFICGSIIASIGQGFSASWWLNKHNTHHAVPNVHLKDPDINTMPFIAWSEDALELFSEYSDDSIAKFWILHQPILLFPLFIFVRLSWYISSFLYPLTGNVKISLVISDILGLTFHCVWQFILPLLLLSPARAAFYFMFSQSLSGALLAFVFVLNHNGRPIINSDTAKAKGFYELQILSSRNINSTPFSDWITGGLNYQIEHHLFPTLPRHNYHLVSPYVREVCAKHKIHYHETSFRQGIIEILKRLRRIRNLAAKQLDSKAQN